MQPHDQDELRRQAQKVLTRRIAADPNRRAQKSDDSERPRDRQVRREPVSEPTGVELAGPHVTESVSPPPAYEQQPVATARRRPTAPDPAPQMTRSAYDIAPPRRSEIYEMLHSRASLRRAIVVSEILGKPKALRESTDPENFSGV